MELNSTREDGAIMMYDGYGNGYGMSGMWLFWLFGLLLLVGMVVLVVFAVRAGGGPSRRASSAVAEGPPTPRRDSPREVLDHRYARGELDSEEYRDRVQTLSATG